MHIFTTAISCQIKPSFASKGSYSKYYDNWDPNVSNLLLVYEELVSKTAYITPDMLLIGIIDFLLQLK